VTLRATCRALRFQSHSRGPSRRCKPPAPSSRGRPRARFACPLPIAQSSAPPRAVTGSYRSEHGPLPRELYPAVAGMRSADPLDPLCACPLCVPAVFPGSCWPGLRILGLTSCGSSLTRPACPLELAPQKLDHSPPPLPLADVQEPAARAPSRSLWGGAPAGHFDGDPTGSPYSVVSRSPAAAGLGSRALLRVPASSPGSRLSERRSPAGTKGVPPEIAPEARRGYVGERRQDKA